MTPLFSVRIAADSDLPFIFNSFLKSFRDSPSVSGVPNTVFYDGHHAVIERLLAHPGARTLVACNAADPAQIYGYAIGRDFGAFKSIDWLYSKHSFRGFGIARSLMMDLVGPHPSPVPLYYTHRVKHMDRLLKNRPMAYHPYLLYPEQK